MKVSALPRVRGTAPDMQRWMELVAQFIESRDPGNQRGNALDTFVTRREIEGSGLLRYDANRPGVLTPVAGAFPGVPPTRVVPPAITDFVAAGAVQTIILSWADPSTLYSNHATTEVYRADVDDFGQAVRIGASRGFAYVDEVGPGSAHYYWIAAVSTNGVVGPINATAGTYAETAVSTAYMLEQLAGEISESELVASLTARIDLIDGSNALPGSVNSRILGAETSLEAYVDAEVAAARQFTSDREALVRSDFAAADSALQTAVDAVPGQISTAVAAETSARTAAIDGIEDSIATINTTLAELQNTPAFDAAESYAIGDLVTFDGSLWQANVALTGPGLSNPAEPDWTQVGEYSSLAEAVAGQGSDIASLLVRMSDVDDSVTGSVKAVDLRVDATNIAVGKRALQSDFYIIESAVEDSTTGLSATYNQLQGVRQSVSVNLIPTSVPVGGSGSDNTWALYIDDTLLSDFGLEASETMSASVEIRTENSRRGRLRLEWRQLDGSFSAVRNVDQTAFTASVGEWTRLVLEDIEIPSDATQVSFGVDNDTNSGLCEVRRLMFNRGPVAMPFDTPRASALVFESLKSDVEAVSGPGGDIERIDASITNIIDTELPGKASATALSGLQTSIDALSTPGGTSITIDQSHVIGLETALSERVQTSAFQTLFDTANATQAGEIDTLQGDVTNLRTSVGTNLLPQETTGGSSTDAGWSYVTPWLLLSDLGLQEGDVISASAVTENEGARAQVLRLQFRQPDGTPVAGGAANDGGGAGPHELKIEGTLIPAGVNQISLGGDNSPNSNSTDLGTISRMMINRGPIALPFEEPRASIQSVNALTQSLRTDLEGQIDTVDQALATALTVTIPAAYVTTGAFTTLNNTVTGLADPGSPLQIDQSNVSGLTAALDNKVESSVYDGLVNTVTVDQAGDISALQTRATKLETSVGANLLPAAAELEGLTAGNGFAISFGVVLEDAGLREGDVISLSGEARSDDTDPPNEVFRMARAFMRFYGPSGQIGGNLVGSPVTSGEYQRTVLEDQTIPAGATSVEVAIDANNTLSGTNIYGRRLMLNRGPTALPFELPRATSEAFDALLATVEDGATVLSATLTRVTNLELDIADADSVALNWVATRLTQTEDTTTQQGEDITVLRGAVTSTLLDRSNLIANSNLDIPSADDKPAGVLPVEAGSTDVIAFNPTKDGLYLLTAPFTHYGVGFPAFAVDPALQYEVIVYATTVSGDQGAGGFFVRFNQTAGDMDPGTTHVGHTANAWTTQRTGAPPTVDVFSHADIDTNGNQEGAATGGPFVGTYTPSPGAKWASLSLYNWGVPNTIEVTQVVVRPIVDADAVTGASSAYQALSQTVTDSEDGVVANAQKITGLEADIRSGRNGGNPLNSSWATDDLEQWSGLGNLDSAVVVSDDASFPGLSGSYIRLTDDDDANEGIYDSIQEVPIDPESAYELDVWVRQPTGDRPAYLVCQFLDENKAQISGNVPNTTDHYLSWIRSTAAYGYPTSAGTTFYFGLVNHVPPSTWTRYRAQIGAALPEDAGPIIPANARFVRLGVFPTRAGSTPTTFEFGSFRLLPYPDALARSVQTVRAEVSDGVRGLEATFNKVEAVETAINHPDDGLNARAKTETVNTQISDVYGADVSQFTNIQAEFTDQGSRIARGDSVVAPIDDPDFGGDKWNHALINNGVVDEYTIDGVTQRARRLDVVGSGGQSQSEIIEVGPDDIIEVSITTWNPPGGTNYVGMYAGNESLAPTATFDDPPDNPIIPVRTVARVYWDPATDEVSELPLGVLGNPYYGAYSGGSVWRTTRGYIFGSQVPMEAARGLLTSGITYGSTLVAFKLHPEATRARFRFITALGGAGATTHYVRNAYARRLSAAEALTVSAGVTRLNTAVADAEAGAIAEAKQQVYTALGGDEAFVISSRQSWNGVAGQWTEKVQVGDLVGGVGFYNDGQETFFAINASKVAIFDGTTFPANAEDALPFVVTGGVTYLKKAAIEELSIDVLKLADGILDNLTAAKGTLAQARIQQGDIFNLTVGELIQSAVYSPGVSGFRIERNGAVEFNSGTFRGAVEFTSAPGGLSNVNARFLQDGPAEADATAGATWGGDISGQPADAALLNDLQEWADVSGVGRPEDNADVTAPRLGGFINPSFETGDLEGWALNGSFTAVAGQAHVGTYACLLNSTTGFASIHNTQRIQVAEGDRVFYQFFWRRTGGSGGVEAVVRWDGDDGNKAFGANASNTGTWERIRGFFTAPAGVSGAQFHVDFSSAVGLHGYLDGFFAVVVPRDSDIDVLQTQNAPLEAGAQATATRIGSQLQNPEFENGNTDWTGQAGWTLINSPAQARLGSWCGQFDGSSPGLLTNTTRIQVAEGDLVFIHGFLRCAAGSARKGVRVSWFNAAGTPVGSPTYDEDDSLDASNQGVGGWQSYTARYRAPTGAIYAQASFVVFPNGAATVYADSLSAFIDQAMPWVRPSSTLIDGSKIFTGDAYVDTLEIKGNAVTVPVFAEYAGADITGSNAYVFVMDIDITIDVSAPILIKWTVQQSAQAGSPSRWGVQVYRDGRPAALFAAEDNLQTQPFASGSVYDPTPNVGLNTYRLEWRGNSAAVILYEASLEAVAVQR